MTRPEFRERLVRARDIASQLPPKADHCLGCVLGDAGLPRGGATAEWNERYAGVSMYYMTGTKPSHAIFPVSRKRLLAIIDASIADFDAVPPKNNYMEKP